MPGWTADLFRRALRCAKARQDYGRAWGLVIMGATRAAGVLRAGGYQAAEGHRCQRTLPVGWDQRPLLAVRWLGMGLATRSCAPDRLRRGRWL